DKKKLILMNLPYILAGYFCDKIAWLWRVSPGSNASDKMMAAMNGLNDLFSNPLPSFFPKDLLIGIAGGVALRLVVYFKAKNAKKFRQGVEYGSARWGNAKDIEPYVDPVFENNVILTETERLMMSGRPKQPKYARNKNILVIGGSGSGKTRFFVKPNLMQMHSSYVVTDPKG
ncbi:MAG: type IV secretory system conjugative DNA transfer family protein, partial [Clostridiales bacterium]|nr:type IV secretory system conjugative DNA transfer family protein [Clostridiales bacterium]